MTAPIPPAGMPETQPTDLAAIRLRLLNATEGPWAIWPDLKPDGLITIGDATGVIPEGEVWTDGPSNTVAHVYTEEDADFIRHAPGDVAALLAEVREVERRAFAFAEEMRTYCAPYGIASIYADRLEAALNSTAVAPSSTSSPVSAGPTTADGETSGEESVATPSRWRKPVDDYLAARLAELDGAE